MPDDDGVPLGGGEPEGTRPGGREGLGGAPFGRRLGPGVVEEDVPRDRRQAQRARLLGGDARGGRPRVEKEEPSLADDGEDRADDATVGRGKGTLVVVQAGGSGRPGRSRRRRAGRSSASSSPDEIVSGSAGPLAPSIGRWTRRSHPFRFASAAASRALGASGQDGDGERPVEPREPFERAVGVPDVVDDDGDRATARAPGRLEVGRDGRGPRPRRRQGRDGRRRDRRAGAAGGAAGEGAGGRERRNQSAPAASAKRTTRPARRPIVRPQPPRRRARAVTRRRRARREARRRP